MSSSFAAIREEFDEELDAIKSIITTFSDPQRGSPKTRVAAINSATLLLAATFEEFVRDMARAYARSVVAGSDTFESLPQGIATIAWRRSMEALARLQLDGTEAGGSREATLVDAESRFRAVYQFCRGDLTQDVFQDLIHNENNMRPNEVNGLFRVSDLRNVCLMICDKTPLRQVFAESEPTKTHGRLLETLGAFFERRNQIAHSIAIMRSAGPDLIMKDIEVFGQFANALCETLESVVPPPREP